jgi:hypothetical protein
MRLRIGSNSIVELVQLFVPYKKRPVPTVQDPSHRALIQVIERLAALNHGTEHDFLTIGARLMEFLDVADRISKGVNAVIQTTAGEQGARASALLEQALERCRCLVATTTQGRTHLACLRNDAVQVASIFGGFRQAVASFHVVCTMTRIEAARLGAAGEELGPLTDEVLALAHRMEAQVQRVLDAAVTIDRHVEEIAAGLRGTNELLDRLALTIPQVLRNLESFSAQQAAAVELSAQLAADSRSASNSIMDAVTSIQFHDITRQQIEHVIAALDHLRAQQAAGNQPHDLATAAKLEAMQLSSASDTFEHSVSRLWHDLESISASVHGMSAHGQTLIAGCGNESTFFFEMQQCLESIAEAAASHRSAQSVTKKAAHALATTLQAMDEAAAEIRGLDVQLLRVALNTNIRAAHLGSLGDTLAILASALQDLAAKAQERSQHAVVALGTMGSAVELLVSHPEEEEDSEALKLKMRDTMDALKTASEEGTLRLTEIAASASRLAEGIAAARDGFHAGRLFSETVPACVASLHEIASQAPTRPATADTAALETFARRYTMQSERDIHASATEHAAPSSTPQLVAAGDTDLGDNIELF